jgi:hypothetical protein
VGRGTALPGLHSPARGEEAGRRKVQREGQRACAEMRLQHIAELFLMAATTTVQHLLSTGVLGVLRRPRGGGDGGTRFGVEPASARCDMNAAHCAADGHYAAAPPSPACGVPPSQRAMLPSDRKNNVV